MKTCRDLDFREYSELVITIRVQYAFSDRHSRFCLKTGHIHVPIKTYFDRVLNERKRQGHAYWVVVSEMHVDWLGRRCGQISNIDANGLYTFSLIYFMSLTL